MKAPKCHRCEGRHWSRQPCPTINTRPAINEERLTDAINAVAPEKPAGVVSRPDLPGVPRSREAEPSVAGRTPNRRKRADYNAPMSEYNARQANLGWLKKSLSPTKQATRDDIVWAAGVYEGEGSCTVAKSSEQARIGQKDAWLPERLRSLFGGSIYRSKAKDYYIWTVSGSRARGFLQSIYGLVSPRRQVQILQALRINT